MGKNRRRRQRQQEEQESAQSVGWILYLVDGVGDLMFHLDTVSLNFCLIAPGYIPQYLDGADPLNQLQWLQEQIGQWFEYPGAQAAVIMAVDLSAAFVVMHPEQSKKMGYFEDYENRTTHYGTDLRN